MIDPHNDNLITMQEASHCFPKINGKLKPASTIYRYTTIGVYGVKLDSYRCGKSVYTTRDAVNEFLAALNAPKDRATIPFKTLTEAGQKRIQKRAEKAKQGIENLFRKAAKQQRKARG